MTKRSLTNNGMKRRWNIAFGMSSFFMQRRLGTRCSNKSRFAHCPRWLCSKDLTKVGVLGTCFVKGTISILSGIGKMLVTLDRIWWVGPFGCIGVVLGWWGGGGPWFGGDGGSSLVGFLVVLEVYVAVCSRLRGPAFPWRRRVLLVLYSFFGVGRLALCLKKTKIKRNKENTPTPKGGGTPRTFRNTAT